MRFMVLVSASKQSESGTMPTAAELIEMNRFNEELINAGVMLTGEGLHPTSKGARIDFTGGKPVAIDGPFAESTELSAWFVAGRG